MLGLETLTPPSMIVLAGLMGCDGGALPEVNINIYSAPVKYNNTKLAHELQHFDIDTVSPYSPDTQTYLSGLHNGHITFAANMDISWSVSPVTRRGCIWVKNIEIDIEHNATIYIAREHRRGSCRYQTTKRHELKHEKVDQRMLKKYRPRFQRAVERKAEEIYVMGPLHESEIKAARQKIVTEIEDTIGGVVEAMNQELKVEQQKVDSLEEYERLSKACRD